MTITLAAPAPPAVLTATARCRCGGFLTEAAGRPAHVDRCGDCLTGPAGAACDFTDLHRTCTAPAPVECRHSRCTADAAPAGDDHCAAALDACCACCLED